MTKIRQLLLLAVLMHFCLWMMLVGTCYAQGKCLIVSDIHFNPDRAYQLKYGHDSNYELLRQSVIAMQNKIAHPDFIVIAGDFIWHGANQPISRETKAAIIDTISALFGRYFSHVPVIAPLGNNDTYQQDYDMQDADFLTHFADDWERNNGRVFNAPFRTKGYYSYEPDGKLAKLKFVVINSSLLSNGSIIKGYGACADTMMRWLDTTLQDAKNKGQKVWIISHIPPGKNVFEILKQRADTMMWEGRYSQTFINLVVKYADVISLSIASHTHFNDIRVFCDAQGKPVSFLRDMPSISPNHYNNPSFEVADFNGSGQLTKETTWYLDLKRLPVNGSITLAGWAEGFSIGTSGLDALTPKAIFKFINEHSKAGTVIPDGYIKFYNVGAIPVPNGSNFASDTYYKYLVTDILKADQ